MAIYAIGRSNMALSALFPTMCPRHVTCPPDLVLGNPIRHVAIEKRQMCLPNTHLTRTLTYYRAAEVSIIRRLITGIFDIAIGFGVDISLQGILSLIIKRDHRYGRSPP